MLWCRNTLLEPLLLPESYHYQPSPESHYDVIDILLSEDKTVAILQLQHCNKDKYVVFFLLNNNIICEKE